MRRFALCGFLLLAVAAPLCAEDHWAYVVPQRHPAPATQNGDWSKNFVDSFILARLEKEGIAPSPEAGKRTLLRRVSFDLVGLPPSPEEVEAFLNDDSPRAYEKVVDRLLASPHYGERMAIQWLDLVRYADSVGYHGDQSVSVSPYRDYVIAAFNANMPYDRFTREQLAGDLLPDATREQRVASGYNRLGMMSAEGGVQPKEYLAKYAADRVRTAAAVWLGSTLGCAECHDHKYDPFTSADFYRFESFFADIKEQGLYSGANATGDWGPSVEVPDEELPELLRPIDERLAELRKVIDTPTEPLAAAQREWEQSLSATLAEWTVLKPLTVRALGDAELKVLEDQSILAGGGNPAQTTYTVTAEIPLKEITGFRIEVLPDPSLPKNGPGRAANGNFVITELRVLRQQEPTPIALTGASATTEQTVSAEKTPDGKWSAASVIDGDANGSNWGWAILPEVGKEHHLVVETQETVANESAATFTFVIEQNHSNPQHTVGRFRISASSSPRPLKADTTGLPADIRKILVIAPESRNGQQAAALAAYYRSIAPSLAGIRAQIDELVKQKQDLIKAHTRTSLVTVSVEPRTMRVLPRGNWMDDSGPIVEPGVPHFLRQIGREGRASRLDLAEWLTARDNPLTARVFVNRLWQLYFGTGLSKVLDDVGVKGEMPTHPELLDTLAVEFMDSGWNVKHLIKLIVMSATYRQSSAMREELQRKDPYNRLLARQARFRLDAELIRDNALAVSGLLVRKIGGRSVMPYQPAGLYRHLNFPKRTYVADVGENQYRRGVYTHWQRQFLHPAMKAFDAPSREQCTAQRPRSNTPLGALVLLNDPSYVEAARVFAAKVIKQGGSDTPERLRWMMQRALSRDPIEKEMAILTELLETQRDQFRREPAEAREFLTVGLSPLPDDVDPVELAAWSSVTRTIFNMHEFITRN